MGGKDHSGFSKTVSETLGASGRNKACPHPPEGTRVIGVITIYFTWTFLVCFMGLGLALQHHTPVLFYFVVRGLL